MYEVPCHPARLTACNAVVADSKAPDKPKAFAHWYVADQLRSWGVKPAGDDGTYFENVRLRGYRTTRNSSVTVTANGQAKTFKHGDHVTFVPRSGGNSNIEDVNAGAAQQVRCNQHVMSGV